MMTRVDGFSDTNEIWISSNLFELTAILEISSDRKHIDRLVVFVKLADSMIDLRVVHIVEVFLAQNIHDPFDTFWVIKKRS